MITMSDLLKEFVKADPSQLEKDETADDWVASMWMARNPAGKLRKAAKEFLRTFDEDDGPAAGKIRALVTPLIE
jgi:hypothetical protein